MATPETPSPAEVPACGHYVRRPTPLAPNADWVENPITRRLIRKGGSTYDKMVKKGVIVDPEASARLAQPSKCGSRSEAQLMSIVERALAARDRLSTPVPAEQSLAPTVLPDGPLPGVNLTAGRQLPNSCLPTPREGPVRQDTAVTTPLPVLPDGPLPGASITTGRQLSRSCLLTPREGPGREAILDSTAEVVAFKKAAAELAADAAYELADLPVEEARRRFRKQMAEICLEDEPEIEERAPRRRVSVTTTSRADSASPARESVRVLRPAGVLSRGATVPAGKNL